MRGLVQRLVGWVLRTFATLIERLASVGFVYSGVVLAAQTFMALLPLLIVLATLLPPWVGTSMAQTLRDRLGLSGSTDAAVGQLLAGRENLHGVGVFGTIVVLASATSFTRALQRVYELSWGLPRQGLRGSLRGVMWLVGLATYLAIVAWAIHVAGTGPPATALKLAVTVVGAVGLWWWTPYVLLMGRVRLRALLPCGLLTGAAMVVMGRVSEVVVPRAVRSNERQFGTIGTVFAIQSWLVVVSCTIVAAAVIGAVAAQTTGPVGRWARGSADLEGWRRSRVGA
ncbi:MAG TPA: ribonuclease BN [Candidatus Limnocylindria bacterium]|nr:ribonuclease BN [Candidatus Limnocylindria bacterium]